MINMSPHKNYRWTGNAYFNVLRQVHIKSNYIIVVIEFLQSFIAMQVI